MEKVNKEDYKLLVSVHGAGQVDDYYHVRTKHYIDDVVKEVSFRFVKATTTRNGYYEKEISESDLPENVKLL